MAMVKDFVMNVCELYFAGLTTKAIAERLHTSVEYIEEIVELYADEFSDTVS